MKNKVNTISVIGLGYIGLPTAAIIANQQIKVIGVDVNKNVVETINRGQIHIVEPDLDLIVKNAVLNGFLRAARKVETAEAFLIAVPTPFKGDREPDLSFVESAAQSIAPVLKKGDLVILESTSPVGTTNQLSIWLNELRPDLRFPHRNNEGADVNIAYCPERVLPGRVIHELVNNDRIIGGITERCSERAKELYEIFVNGSIRKTNARTAEMCKLTENSYRDVNIAFANEISLICEKIDIDVWELITLANKHPRVNILNPGPGVGGHCIAVDPWFIVSENPEQARLIRCAREVNDSKPHWVVKKALDAVTKLVKGDPRKKTQDLTICCYGLAFKPNIDDFRESPAMEITSALSKLHPGKVLAVEPYILNRPDGLPGNVEIVGLQESFCR